LTPGFISTQFSNKRGSDFDSIKRAVDADALDPANV